MFIRMWKGETPLVVAFWGWLILGGGAGWNVFWVFFFQNIGNKSGIFYDIIFLLASRYGVHTAYSFVYLLLFVNALYCMFVSRGVYKSAWAYKKSNAWRYAALVFTAAYIVTTAQKLFVLFERL